MVIGAIFAGGIGSRMGSADMPKQYLQLGSKPIIVHTIEKFVVNPGIDRIIVLCPKAWIAHTKDLVKKYLGEAIAEKINVVEGGSTRNGTLENALKFINENFAIDDDSVIVTHDAVRPFVTHRIIDENIEAAKKYGACDTVIPATDTIVRSEDSENVSSIPTRSELYQGQTPQSFRIKELESVLNGKERVSAVNVHAQVDTGVGDLGAYVAQADDADALAAQVVNIIRKGHADTPFPKGNHTK